MKSSKLGIVVLSSALLFLLSGMDCPTDHPAATMTDTVSFAAANSGSGARSSSVSSGFAAPHFPFELMVNISSDQPVFEGEAQVFITFQCAFGNTKTFEMALAEEGDGLSGVFARAANLTSSDECIGDGNQRERVTWTVQFVRPSGVFQTLNFDYQMTWRQASSGN